MTDLERRLRAAVAGGDEYRAIFGWDDILAAAVIGAEVEREACARLIEECPMGQVPGWAQVALAQLIRARSAK